MATVVMMRNEYTEYGRLFAGQSVSVPDQVAMRWQKAGVAYVSGPEIQVSRDEASAARVPSVRIWGGADKPKSGFVSWRSAAPNRPSQGWTRGYNWAWLKTPALIGGRLDA